jgi:ACT domain-containing protein
MRMRAIVTVIGKDRVGIIASVTNLLSSYGVNVLDISQTVLQEYFTMIMLVDTVGSDKTFDEIGDVLHEKELQTGLSIRIQREDIFHAMHRI